jgi:uncharacterized protein
MPHSGAEQQPPWTITADGLIIHIRLTPKAAYDGLDGIEQTSDGRHILKIRLRALPSEGEANKALCSFIAKLCKRPKSAVSLLHGGKSRYKTIHIAGDPDIILAQIKTHLTLTAE